MARGASSLRAVVLVVLNAVASSKVFVDTDPELLKYESGRLHYAEHNGAVMRSTTTGANDHAPQQRLHVHVHAQVLEENARVITNDQNWQNNCVSKEGDMVVVNVHYHSSDGRSASALAFSVRWDPHFFELVEEGHAVWQHHVRLRGCSAHNNVRADARHGFVSYRCASVSGYPVPSEIASVVSVQLRALRAPTAADAAAGTWNVRITPDDTLRGVGYGEYAASKPLNLGCIPYTQKQVDTMLRRCPAGKFGTARRWREAGSGSFSAQLASAMCTDCPTGKYNNGRFRTALCRMCPAGHHAPIKGALVCDACAGGKLAVRPGAVVCADCPPGTFAPSTPRKGIKRCHACGPGEYNDLHGQRKCKTCPDGKFQWILGQTMCDIGAGCVVGRYHRARSGAESDTFYCAACPRGKYQPRANQNACITCPLGTFQILSAQNGCNRARCRPGERYNPAKYRGCMPCAQGHFSIVNVTTGALLPGPTCFSCPKGKFQWRSGQGNCYRSACKPGTYQFSASKDCVLCRPGRYQPRSGQSSCMDCPKGMHSEAGANVCEDPKGDAELLRSLLRMKKNAETPRECSHMRCRLEEHSCKKVRMLNKDQPGYGRWVKDCESTTLTSEQILHDKKDGFPAGTWTSIRSYHQTEEAIGTLHRCGIEQGTGECKCMCWTRFTGGAHSTAHELMR